MNVDFKQLTLNNLQKPFIKEKKKSQNAHIKQMKKRFKLKY